MSALTGPLPRHFPSVVHMLADAAARRPHAAALRDPRQALDYATYAAAVEGLARRLRGAGLGHGGVGLTLLDNAAETCVAMLAIQAAGAQACTANPAYTPRELAEILIDAAPVVAIVHAARRETLESALRDCPTRPALVVVADGPGFVADAVERGAGGLLDPSRAEPDALAVLQYTGGTTGRAKGVQLTHRAVATNVAQREAVLPTRLDAERVLGVMPLFHSFGSAMLLHLSIACRGELVLLDRYRPEAVTAALAEHAITLFPAGPTVYNSLLAHPPFREGRYPALRWCASGSAALPEATLARWLDVVGAPIHEGYGQTEAGPVLTYQGPFEASAPRTVGRPLPLTEIDLVALDDADRAPPPGEAGEIRARGPQVMAGYRDRPAETAEALRDGWLHTGDVGRFDAAGRLVIEDRKKELVIVSGYNVYPREVEEVLAACPGVGEAAVVGAPDAYRGEALHAFVAATAAPEAVAAWCAERLARYKQPTRWTRLDALPRTSVGKVDKLVLRALAREAAATAEAAA